MQVHRIEVFRTNITQPSQACIVLETIHRQFEGYSANFDLEDCDRILRVDAGANYVDPEKIIKLVEHSGFSAEILPDTIPLIQM